MADRTVVGVLFPGPAHRDALDPLYAVADDLGLQVEMVDWADQPDVALAVAAGRSRAWVAAHQAPLTDRQRRQLARAEVLLALDVPLQLPTLAPRLRWVQAVGAGIGPLAATLRGTGIPVCTTAGASSVPIAEFVMARLLGVWKQSRAFDRLQRARRWPAPDAAPASVGVAGRTLGIVGTGSIGREIARRAAAFDLRVVGVRRRPDLPPPPGFDRVVGADRLMDVLPDCDALVLAAPGTPRTDRLIGRDQLSALPTGAVLCNVARGTLVDEAALADALRSGHLAAAVLDVTDREPLSRRSPLWALPGAHLSPHASALVPGHLRRVTDIFVDNLRRDRAGEPLRNPADLDEGY
ncbi:MAG TPA: D-2-hydroxyacid dehydrogenase [Acidimicrobiales bacterium]|nr:D-2-hydroxyacid dehydrogenase [Acidimicrobiales bacterium]